MRIEELEDRCTPSTIGNLALGSTTGTATPNLIVATSPGTPTAVQAYYGSNFDYNDQTAYTTGQALFTTPLTIVDTGGNSINSTNGAFVASANVNNDGYDDIIMGSGVGDPALLNIYNGKSGSLITSQTAFAGYTGGVQVAAADTFLVGGTPSGYAYVVVGEATGDAGGSSVQVLINNNGTLTPGLAFEPFGSGYTGGLSLAVGQFLNSQGTTVTTSSPYFQDTGGAFLIVAQASGASPQVKVYDLSAFTITTTPSALHTLTPKTSDGSGGLQDFTAGVQVTANTGKWLDGMLAFTSASAGTPYVSLYKVASGGGFSTALLNIVDLTGLQGVPASSATPGVLRLVGGGFINANGNPAAPPATPFPLDPLFVVGQVGENTVDVIAVNLTYSSASQPAATVLTTADLLTPAQFDNEFAGSNGTGLTGITIPTTPATANQPELASMTVLGASNTSRWDATVFGLSLTMLVPTLVDYHTPFQILPNLTADFISSGGQAGFNVSPWNDPQAWYSGAVDAEYGPQAVNFDAPANYFSHPVSWFQQRLIFAGYTYFLGSDYQHHHVSSWNPGADSSYAPHWGSVQTIPYLTPGLDCSDFSLFLYDYALGIRFATAQTGNQANLTTATLYLTPTTTVTLNFNQIAYREVLPNGDTAPMTEAGFQQLVSVLQPGDLIYINSQAGNEANAGGLTAQHVVMFLGQYATDTNGQYQYLVMDSTGASHVDSNGNTIPQGVQIHPFFYSPNAFYANGVLQVRRVDFLNTGIIPPSVAIPFPINPSPASPSNTSPVVSTDDTFNPVNNNIINQLLKPTQGQAQLDRFASSTSATNAPGGPTYFNLANTPNLLTHVVVGTTSPRQESGTVVKGASFSDRLTGGAKVELVQLLDNGTAVVATIRADANGNFFFSNVPDGKYVVQGDSREVAFFAVNNGVVTRVGSLQELEMLPDPAKGAFLTPRPWWQALQELALSPADPECWDTALHEQVFQDFEWANPRFSALVRNLDDTSAIFLELAEPSSHEMTLAALSAGLLAVSLPKETRPPRESHGD